MTDLFLSYKREDRETAKNLAEALEAKGCGHPGAKALLRKIGPG